MNQSLREAELSRAVVFVDGEVRIKVSVRETGSGDKKRNEKTDETSDIRHETYPTPKLRNTFIHFVLLA